MEWKDLDEILRRSKIITTLLGDGCESKNLREGSNRSNPNSSTIDTRQLMSPSAVYGSTINSWLAGS